MRLISKILERTGFFFLFVTRQASYNHISSPCTGCDVTTFEQFFLIFFREKRAHNGERREGIMVRKYMKSTRRVLGNSLVRSLVHSHSSLIRLLRIARFARALLRSFIRSSHSLTHSLPKTMEKRFMSCMSRFHTVSTHCAAKVKNRKA